MLKRRAFTATLWSGGDILLRQGTQFVTTIVLARLLTPADFGVIAMLALFIGVVYVLMDGGFAVALIQRREVDEIDKSTVFWFNVSMGGLLTLALIATAPAIARFYDVPFLAQVAPVMALTCLLASFGTIHGTLLSRDLNFRVQAQVGVIAALASAAVAITLAIRGFGVWALVAQSLVMSATSSLLLWVFHPWRPLWVFSGASLRKLLGFSSYHLASTLLEMVYSKLYTLFVGRLFGARELGYYANAENTRMIPGNFLAGVVSRVALPLFSEAGRDPATLRRGMQLSIRGMMIINAPVMMYAAVLSEPLVMVLFGAQWLGVVPILRLLCLAGVLYPLHVINLHALMAQGYAGLMFRLEVTKKLIGVVLLFVGANYGVKGIAWSQVVLSIIALWINAHYSQRIFGFGISAQLKECGSLIGVSASVAIGIWVIAPLLSLQPMMKLVVLGSVGAASYLIVIVMLKNSALADVMTLFRRASGRLS